MFKTVILAQVNGQTPTGLAKTLGCPKAQAEQYVARLFDAYPDVAGYLELLRRELVITGQVTTWRGRTRTVTAHRWMVDETRVRVLLIYEDGNHYWFDVSATSPDAAKPDLLRSSSVVRVTIVKVPSRPGSSTTQTGGELVLATTSNLMNLASITCRFETYPGREYVAFRNWTQRENLSRRRNTRASMRPHAALSIRSCRVEPPT